MKRLRIAIDLRLAVLASLTFAACTSSSAALYRQASVQVSEKDYRLVTGTEVVFESCFRKTQPYPDAVSGYCIVIPVEPHQLVVGRVIRFGPTSTRAYLWQLNGPSHNLTHEVEGELRIVTSGAGSIRAALHAKTSTAVIGRWQWKFEGEDRYILKSLPPPNG